MSERILKRKREQEYFMPAKAPKIQNPLPWNDTNDWIVDQGATEYANELMNIEETKLNHDIHVLDMKTYLQTNEEKVPQVFTRKANRDAWKKVYDYCKKDVGNHAVVTGNPGIGKSRSMAYLLRLLLKDQKVVVYLAKKDKSFFAFFWKDGKYSAWRKGIDGFDLRGCEILRDKSNFLLIDPSDAEGESAVSAHTIVAASPNRKHYHEFRKNDGCLMFFLPVWKERELTEVRGYFKIKESPFPEEEIKKRFGLVGGIPRFIFSNPERFQEQLSIIQEDLHALKLDDLIKALKKETTLEVSQSSNRGSSVSSSLICWDQSATDNSYLLPKRKQRIISDYIRLEMIKRYYDHVNQALEPNIHSHTKNPSAIGFFFEYFSQTLIKYGGTFKVKELKRNSSENNKTLTLEIPRASKEIEVVSWKDFKDECSKLPKVANMKERVVLVPVQNHPVIDMADACDRAYQVTLASSHQPKAQQLGSLLSKTKSFLNLYFVIPEHRFINFEYQKPTGESKRNQSFETKMKQWALCIPKDLESLCNTNEYLKSIFSEMQKDFQKRLGTD